VRLKATGEHEMGPVKRGVFLALLAGADVVLRIVEATARWRRSRARTST
jgi:hypothetical protein